MKVIKKIEEIRNIIKEWKKAGESVGLVPTMGYLHNGHGTLIKESVKNNNRTVVSIFVNPTQFGANEDYSKYPRDIEKDSAFVEQCGADIIFNPEPEEMYKNQLTIVKVEGLSEKLCGITRPVHFAGVTQVVSKLFNIVKPDNAYFGLKDFQQYVIIKKMVDDLNFNVKINGVSIVREESGLALSSRNTYLSDEEKKSALSLSKALKYAVTLIEKGERVSAAILKEMETIITKEKNTRIDYIKIINPDTLEDIENIDINSFAILMAVYVGSTRLIDNYTKLG